VLVPNAALGLGADLLSGIVQGEDGHNGAGRHRGTTYRCALAVILESRRARGARKRASSFGARHVQERRLLSKFCLMAGYW